MLRDFFANFRIADAADIAVVAVFAYGALLWIRRTANRSVVIGVGMLAVVYFVSRALEMVLTSMLFQFVAAVLVIALVVVFQEDLRRTFERLAGWGTLRDARRTPPPPEDADVIAETAFRLAQTRTGALLVLPGRDSLERHVTGGTELKGRVSPTILLSIFDPGSPGHDGAAIVRHGRIERFGAHLPLSKRTIAGRGTRHRAAVGLSEVSDALVVVVSEERGTVCIAERGVLEPVADVEVLRDRIRNFLGGHVPPPPKLRLRHLITRNGRLKLAAVAIACVSWFLIAYQADEVLRTYTAQVEYRNLPEGLELVPARGAAGDIQVTLSGPENAHAALGRDGVRVVVDLKGRGPDEHYIDLEPDDVEVPASLDVADLDPAWIRVELRRRGE